MSSKSSSHTAIGSVLIVIGLLIAVFAYAHRPPDNLIDAMNRGNSFILRPGAYYMFLLIGAMFGLAGIVRFMKANAAKPSVPPPPPGGSTSAADEIRKAKGLLDAGAISAAEFEAIKAKTLR